MRITFTTTTAGPAGKLADAEITFEAGEPLAGLRLIGFALWQRTGGTRINVTFPARQYSINGERRSFALLRPADGAPVASEQLRDRIVEAWTAQQTAPAPTPAADDTVPF